MTTRYTLMLQFSFIYILFCICILLFFAIWRGIFKTKNSGLGIIFFILIIISSIRVNNGSDFFNYYNMYNNSIYYYQTIIDVIKSSFQHGYMVLSYITKKYVGGDFSIFSVCAILINSISFFVIAKHSKSPVMSVSIYLLMGYFLMSNNILKQSLAMSIMMFSLLAFYNKRYVLFAFLSLLSCVFHLSSIIFIIIILVSKLITINIRTLNIIVLISFLFIPFTVPILRLVTSISFLSKYQVYVENSIEKTDIRFVISTIFFILVHIILMYIVVINYQKFNFKKGSLEELLIKIMILSISISIISLRLYYVNRISFFGFQFLIILIPNIVATFESKVIRKKIRFILYGVFILYGFTFTLLSGENNYYNYSTRFNDIPVSVQDFVRRDK